MLKLDGVETFVAVADAGSISAAARRLGLPKSVVSERLAELERALGAQLAQRTTRKMTLTEDGAAFLERARRILQETREAAAEMAERRGDLVGPLRLSGPLSFGSLHLGPALYPFLLKYPAITLTLDLDDRFVDIAADGYDAVIRHGPVGDHRLITHRLASSRRFLVASPTYLAERGEPRSAAELERHKAILYINRESDWRFAGASGAVAVHPVVGLRVNNGLIMRSAAIAGLGITLLPSFMIQKELQSGALRVVNIGMEPETAELFLAHPSNRSASAKLRALTRHLREAFGDPPYWDG